MVVAINRRSCRATQRPWSRLSGRATERPGDRGRDQEDERPSDRRGERIDIHEIVKVFKEIPRLLTAGKSVTKSAREQIIKLCNITREACEARGLEMLPSSSTGCGPLLREDVAAIERTEVRAAVVEAVRTEIGRVNRPPLSFSQVAAMPPGGRLGAKPPAGASPSSHPELTKPALILTCEEDGAPRERATRALSEVIGFRETRYRPTAIRGLSNKRMKVEFDSEEQREDAL